MIRLIKPTATLRDSWWEQLTEFGSGHPHGAATFAFTNEELASDDGFAAWLQEMHDAADHSISPKEGWVHASLFWIVDDSEPNRVLGSLHLRHELNDFLREEGGHIGYGVRPSARGRGVATAALKAALEESRNVGLARVLVTCDEDNEPSRRTIERCGGVLEDVRQDKRRYWISLTQGGHGSLVS